MMLLDKWLRAYFVIGFILYLCNFYLLSIFFFFLCIGVWEDSDDEDLEEEYEIDYSPGEYNNKREDIENFFIVLKTIDDPIVRAIDLTIEDPEYKELCKEFNMEEYYIEDIILSKGKKKSSRVLYNKYNF